MEILPIAALKDNYIWCLIKDNQCLVVDPGEAPPVIEFLEKKGLELKAILVTHHHHDHTQGIEQLVADTHIPVYGSHLIPWATDHVKDQEKIHVDELDISFKVIAIPGHTLEHVAYYHQGLVFTGDTLFTGGCGRIFEGTPQQMHESLEKLKQLPPDTNIYCGHEYTLQNLEFAKLVEPENQHIIERYHHAQERRHTNQPTVPAPLSLELATNPFLRCAQPGVAAAASYKAGYWLNDETEVLAALREWKNSL